jgi:hypothetical protein
MLFVSAIRTYSRGWPRSSSTREPSDPPLRMMESIRFFLSYTIIFENIFCFGRSPGRTQDLERRTPSKHPSSILLTTRFENFASSKRDRSLYSTRASDSLNLPLPTQWEGVLETNANPLRPDETAGVRFDRYPKKNRAGYIYTLRPSRSRTSDNESQKSRMRARIRS